MKDEPSFLTSPPSVLDPAEPKGVLQTPPGSPYRTPGVPSGPPRRETPAPEPAPPRTRPFAIDDVTEPVIGDRAGEHLAMPHGRYSAWTHVVAAFLLESLLFGLIPATLYEWVADSEIPLPAALLAGAIPAWLVFRDRWRCIEAHASRFCSGLLNLSLLYVPFISLVYANARGLAKLRERRSGA